ncbi:MAG: transcription-repair coupling factor [Pseudomonadota bacterium]|nr:transcription-repair coupling factor [Pseudomonadota bacterium]
MKQRLGGVPSGYEAFVLKKLFSLKKSILYIVPNETKLSFVREILRLVAPHFPVLTFLTWDTVPYDRTAPATEIIGERIDTLSQLINPKAPVILLTTASATLQRVPPPDYFQNTVLELSLHKTVSFDRIQTFLARHGYHLTNTVMESGDFAVRGGLIDIFPAGSDMPVRVDFFGDEVDSLKSFDVLTQRTVKDIPSLILKPISEFLLTPESISLFRSRYRELFEVAPNDTFYESVTNGRYIQGLEHFLPLFHKRMVPIWDYLSNYITVLDYQTPDAFLSRWDQIQEYYDARIQALTDGNTFGSIYHPIPPELFFIDKKQIDNLVSSSNTYQFSPFVEADTQDAGGRSGHDFTDIRVQDGTDVFDAVATYIAHEKRKVVLTASTAGACDRLAGLMRERKHLLTRVDTFDDAVKNAPSVMVSPFERGFSTDQFIIITETDILGSRIIRPVKKNKSKDFLTDLTTLNTDDLVVHQIHGIGRFKGLISLQIAGAAHDCLCLEYDGGDKLFIPVENMDILSRYGNADTAMLDRLGSTSFVSRKERVKKDLFQMAERLMQTASKRALQKTDHILAPHGLYQEFCARFPYSETDDQIRTISEIETDLATGRPMDRLVCGDVGFGKTEVAMRAAFLTVMSGYQVAVIVPTTLLARQHTQNFMERFRNFPVRIAGLSRLTTTNKAKQIREELNQGTLDIIIGTHALLSKTISFKNLGLVIVDEEQHFGVAHKERLKELKEGVHVLTLTATPIPRTLQLSLSGVRELSVIATPPVDRLAVKTFVTPFDPVVIKEAILREHFRGGQTFFVCPRISDMDEVSDILSKIVPDIRVVVAHGQMPATKLEKIMTDFSDKKYDVLLATSIVESGLDIASVNTIIIYRADMFGLAALYQLRGRVGRGKLRAYAYLTTPPHQRLNDTAQKRLTVMQSLDSLGAGFALASHDLDIRGAGNLLGQEQSGHIREVGVSLYQKMLADAIRMLKEKGTTVKSDEDYSPQISIGMPVLIPSDYIEDLNLRLNLYHRIGEITESEEIESMRAEFTDRFGPYPVEVENLFQTIELKLLAKSIHIEKLEAGPKGASISFYHNIFPNPAGLIRYIETQMGTIRIRPDQKLIVIRPWKNPSDRLTGVRNIIKKLSEIASLPQ